MSGAAILDCVAALIHRYVYLSDIQSHIAAVWVAHTHAIKAARETPYLAISSAEKQSGKTRLLETLELLVNKPWLTGRVTAACLIRKVDQVSPTLLLDESDAAFNGEKEYAEALRGILNSGHREDGKASCCVGQGANVTVKDFKTFCPKAVAGIGRNLPDTVMDRSIPISLKRQAVGERVERFRRRDIKPQADELKKLISDWLADILSELREARPALPEEISDRRQDGLEPLLAIAEAAGGEWPERIRTAALQIFGSLAASDKSLGVLLLSDIRSIFDEHEDDKITTKDLISKLKEIETSPWADLNHGKGLTDYKLAGLLKKYEIGPKTVRLADRTAKGYQRDWFDDAWSRYLPPVSSYTGSGAVTSSQPACLPGETHFSEPSQGHNVTASKSASNPHKHGIVTDVTALRPLHERTHAKEAVHTLPSCPKCGSFAIYKTLTGDHECQTCGGVQ